MQPQAKIKGITGLCVGNSPVTDEFPANMASNAENISIWWQTGFAGELYAHAVNTSICTMNFLTLQYSNIRHEWYILSVKKAGNISQKHKTMYWQLARIGFTVLQVKLFVNAKYRHINKQRYWNQ